MTLVRTGLPQLETAPDAKNCGLICCIFRGPNPKRPHLIFLAVDLDPNRVWFNPS